MKPSSTLREEIALYLGIGRSPTSHGEKWLSGIGGGLSIAALILIGMLALNWYGDVADSTPVPYVIASMAASAVLLFAVPHGALSQPWPLLAGHVSSAMVGVWCSLHIDHVVIAGGLATGAAITVMHYFRCMHPPGGATALSAVLSEQLVDQAGYGFVVFPVFIGAVSILLIAFLFNFAFRWRRYPAHLFYQMNPPPPPSSAVITPTLSQEDFFAAMEAHGSLVDVTAEGLTELLERAQQHAAAMTGALDRFEPGQFYSNGALGHAWSVREVVRIDGAPGAQKSMLHYRVIAGSDHPGSGACGIETFREWARFEVARSGNLWRKCGP